jgi:hypothetical protein
MRAAAAADGGESAVGWGDKRRRPAAAAMADAAAAAIGSLRSWPMTNAPTSPYHEKTHPTQTTVGRPVHATSKQADVQKSVDALAVDRSTFGPRAADTY